MKGLHCSCCTPSATQLMRSGNKSLIGTESTRDSMTSSKSPIHRVRPSIVATMSLLMSQPKSWHFAASSDWDQPRNARYFLTWGPTMFRGFWPVWEITRHG